MSSVVRLPTLTAAVNPGNVPATAPVVAFKTTIDDAGTLELAAEVKLPPATILSPETTMA